MHAVSEDDLIDRHKIQRFCHMDNIKFRQWFKASGTRTA